LDGDLCGVHCTPVYQHCNQEDTSTVIPARLGIQKWPGPRNSIKPRNSGRPFAIRLAVPALIAVFRKVQKHLFLGRPKSGFAVEWSQALAMIGEMKVFGQLVAGTSLPKKEIERLFVELTQFMQFDHIDPALTGFYFRDK
jgi:hypothetical protein